jgi:sulfoacetaldehyde dehydrogenase
MTVANAFTADDVAMTIHRARAAASEVEFWPQEQVDRAVVTVGWECYREDSVTAMSRFACESTGLGDPADMFTLHRRRVLGILRDLHGVTTIGIVDAQPELGTARYAKPVGVIAATCPATAPCLTAVCIALPMLKTRNAVVLIPSPRGRAAVAMAVDIMREALTNAGAPADLIQCAPTDSKDTVVSLMRATDLVVATGGEHVLRRAYSTGTPAIGAGVGNATVIVDESADLAEAAGQIAFGAGFNNGTSCSSESNVLVAATAAADFTAQLAKAGAHICTAADVGKLRSVLWPDGSAINRSVVGRSATELAADAGIAVSDSRVAVLAAPLESLNLDDPLLGEKLSPVCSLVSYTRFDEAIAAVQGILARSGSGHSCGIHTRSEERVAQFAQAVHSARVLVNQPVAVGNSGSFENGLPFTPTVACGSWGGCGQSENITWRNYLNYTTVARRISPAVPDEDVIFGSLAQSRQSGQCATRAVSSRPRSTCDPQASLGS